MRMILAALLVNFGLQRAELSTSDQKEKDLRRIERVWTLWNVCRSQ
jgi:hypothetical protein